EFDDIKLKLDSIHTLPDGAGPITFVKDFGDTAALMLTVASPKTGPVEIALRAKALQNAIEQVRKTRSGQRITIAHGLPQSLGPDGAKPAVDLFIDAATADGLLRDARVIQGPGFVAVDAASNATDAEIEAFTQRFLRERLRAAEIHPDAWTAIVIRDP